MADNLGPMAWLFLPENVQVQYLQKIALRAENNCSSLFFRPFRLFFREFSELLRARMDFPHEVRFFAGIGPAHFPAAFRMLLSQHSKEGAPIHGDGLSRI